MKRLSAVFLRSAVALSRFPAERGLGIDNERLVLGTEDDCGGVLCWLLLLLDSLSHCGRGRDHVGLHDGVITRGSWICSGSGWFFIVIATV
jgi:hypothetical protein